MQEIIKQMLNLLFTLLPKDKFNTVVDSLLDKLEEQIEESENKWDDALALPLITKIRELLNVPDND
jgi:hypothetical protein